MIFAKNFYQDFGQQVLKRTVSERFGRATIHFSDEGKIKYYLLNFPGMSLNARV